MTLTTAEAAELADIQPGSFRGQMSRLRARGLDLRAPRDQWHDRRTPVWDEARLRAWLASRTTARGQGA